MRRYVETFTFVSLAIGVHIAFAVELDDSAGSIGGVGGEYKMSLQASSTLVEQVLEEWTKPPEHHLNVVEDLSEPVLDTPKPPAPPLFQAKAAPRAAVQIAALEPMDKPLLPTIDMSVAPPPPKPKPRPELKPKKAEKPKPKPKPKEKQKGNAKVNAIGQKKQKAAGGGGSAHAGGNGKVAAQGSGKSDKLVAVWGAKVRAKIERSKRSPRGIKGKFKTSVSLRVSRDGKLQSAKVTGSSGNTKVDQYALQSVKRAGRFPKAPKGLTDSSYTFYVSLNFKM